VDPAARRHRKSVGRAGRNHDRRRGSREAAGDPGISVHALRRAGDPGAAVPAGRPAAAAGAALFSGMAAMTAALLEVRGLTKKFGGVTALDGIELAVGRGEILRLIRPTGSGTTTLFNVITRISGPAAGSLRFDGDQISRASPRR